MMMINVGGDEDYDMEPMRVSHYYCHYRHYYFSYYCCNYFSYYFYYPHYDDDDVGGDEEYDPEPMRGSRYGSCSIKPPHCTPD